MADKDERLPPGYDVLETLYRSSSKVVFRARRQLDGRPVVLKCLNKPSVASRRRMEREVAFLRRLHGTEVVDFRAEEGVIILGDDGGLVGSVLLEADAPVDARRDVRAALKIALQLARALNIVHGHRICHNDMKPRNFLYLHDPISPRIILLDFDLASNFDEATTSSTAMGTVEYMSPEQTGQLALARDYRTDLYSLGVILYQLCTGHLPYSGSSMMEVFHATIAAQPTTVASANTSIPLVLSNVVMTLLNKNPDQRYQSAFGLAHDLERCLAEWSNLGLISSFPLRERDCPVVFRIPRGLFGRESELALLQVIYENTRANRKPRYLLIGGPAGVGKSSILSTLQSGFPGIFIVGKYEHNRGESPYFAFVQAINMLARNMLVSPPAELGQYRTQILTAVSNVGAVLTNIFHDLERVIGEQPAVPDLPPSEAQNRFKTVFFSFIRTFCAPERPLLLFLDDMQWADSSSLVLWRSLITAEIPGLMMVCAYRDNEVPAGHPFDVAVKDVTSAGILIESMQLRPIQAPAIVSILTAAIKISPEDAAPLAELLLQKTLGNPFFLNRYIKALYEENLLRFDWRTGIWTYDLQRIQSSVLAENAAQLMTVSFQKLDPMIRDPLVKASCIGAQFSIGLLAVVTNLPEEELSRILINAVDQAYIFKISVETFKFSHDNVHSAAYAQLAPKDKKAVHLQLGRAMLKLLPPEALEDNLFDLLRQLNAGTSLMTDPAELFRLAQLNRSGMQMALKATATSSAFEYASAGLEALARADPNFWTVHHSLAFELSLDRSVALALNPTRFDEAMNAFEELATHCNSPAESIEVFTPKLLHLHMAGKQKEACAVGIRCLEALGETLPLEPTDAYVDTCLAEFDAVMASKKFEEFAQMRAAGDPIIIARQRCLGNMTAASFFYSANSCAVISARNSIIGLKYGITPYTGIGLVFLAMVYGIREKFDIAYDVGRLAVAFADRFDDQNYKGRIYFMFGAHINWFRKPISDDLTFLRVACKLLLSTFDYTYASYAHCHFILTHLLSNESVDTALHEAKQVREVLRSRIHSPHMLVVLEEMILIFQMLVMGPQVNQHNFFNSPEVVKLETSIMNETTPLTVSWWLCVKVYGLYCLEKYEEAIAAGKLNEPTVSAVRGHLMLPFWYYPHYALSILAAYSKTPEDTARAELMTLLKPVMGWVNAFARNSPINLGYIEKIVQARYKEVIEHDLPAASKMYDEAVSEAEKVRSMYWHGLALSLGASCAAALGTSSVARLLLREACSVYTSWGAATLVAVISRHHSLSFNIGGGSSLPATHSNSSSSGPSATLSPFVNLNAQLDAETVLQVARALSQEIVLEKLLSEVMRIIAENTSAEFVCLAMQKEGEDLEIVTSKHAGTLRTTKQTATMVTVDKLTAEIIRFVNSLSEGVLLENAYLDPRFCPDGRPLPGLVRSVLCVPISTKTTAKAVLYMENSTVASAFSPARMQIVHAILPQIAISIENATLVKRLTLASEELKRKNEALRQDDVRKDQFLAITTHELRTPLHGVIGATSLLLETSPLSTEQQEYASVILGASKSLLTLVNDILDLTKMQFQSQKVRIEPRTVSVVSVVEAALEVVSGGAAEKGLELAYVLGNSLPATHLFHTDPVRVQQVLTNLLANAIKFTAKGYVLLTVSAEGTTDADMFLKFMVVDTGIGIPPEKIPRLFKMFAQLDAPETSRYDGYGVGLFICSRLLDLLGGTVTAESDGKSGSTFTVRIPAAPVACCVPPRIGPLTNMCAVLHFAEQHSYAFMEPPLTRAHIPVHTLLSLDALPELLAKVGNVRVVFFVDLALAQTLRRAIPPNVSYATVALAYAQKWKLYPDKEGLTPLFRPVQHAKIITVLQAAMSASKPAIAGPTFIDPKDAILTASTSGPKSARDTPTPVPTPNGPKLHVLVVEDNLVNSKLLCRILEGTYTTATAINGVEAIKAVGERLPDLVLMDIQMPVMDGIAATKEIRRLGHTFPIVAATASFTDSDKAMCMEAGMDDILPKPFTKPAVLAAVLKNLNVRKEQR